MYAHKTSTMYEKDVEHPYKKKKKEVFLILLILIIIVVLFSSYDNIYNKMIESKKIVKIESQIEKSKISSIINILHIMLSNSVKDEFVDNYVLTHKISVTYDQYHQYSKDHTLLDRQGKVIYKDVLKSTYILSGVSSEKDNLINNNYRIYIDSHEDNQYYYVDIKLSDLPEDCEILKVLRNMINYMPMFNKTTNDEFNETKYDLIKLFIASIIVYILLKVIIVKYEGVSAKKR